MANCKTQAIQSEPQICGQRGARTLALICLLAAALRLVTLGWQSLWVDEIRTLQNLTPSLVAVIPKTFLHNNAPPLFFILAWLSRALFGESPWALRLPAALAGIASIPLMYHLVRRLFTNTRTANVAALLLAVNPLHIWFSQEARNYTLVLALALAACLAYLQAQECGRSRNWVMLAVIIALAASTATQGALIIPVIATWALLSPPPKPARRPLLIVLCATAAFAAAIGWLLLIHGNSPPPPRSFSGAEIPYTIYTFVMGYSFGPSLSELQVLPLAQAVKANITQLAIGGSVTTLTLLAWLKYPRRKSPLPWLWLLGGIGFALCIHFLSPHSYHVRYALPGLIGLILLTAGGLTHWCSGRGRAAITTLITLGMLASTAQLALNPKYAKEDTREAVALALQIAPQAECIWVAPGYMKPTVDYYLRQHDSLIETRELLSATDFNPRAPDQLVLLTRPQHIPFRADLDTVLSEAQQTLNWHSTTTRSYRILSPQNPEG